MEQLLNSQRQEEGQGGDKVRKGKPTPTLRATVGRDSIEEPGTDSLAWDTENSLAWATVYKRNNTRTLPSGGGES